MRAQKVRLISNTAIKVENQCFARTNGFPNSKCNPKTCEQQLMEITNREGKMKVSGPVTKLGDYQHYDLPSSSLIKSGNLLVGCMVY